MKRYFSVRCGRFSVMMDKKAVWIISSFAVLTGLVFTFGLMIGETPVSLPEVIQAFFGRGENAFVILTLRFPRILIAMMSGAALALSGAILQAVIRNPLASPDIIGVTGGASVGAVGVITFFSDWSSNLSIHLFWVPFAAFIGASVVGALIYFLSWNRGVSPLRLVLMGIGFYTATQALTNLIILFGPVFHASQSKMWITGTVYGSNWDQVAVLWPWLLLLISVALLFARHLNSGQLGEEVVKGLGGNSDRIRIGFLLLSTGLAGSGVAFAGGISFVGLIAPHLARRLVGASYGAMLPLSGLLGAVFVMVADIIGRTVLAPAEIPAGVFTAVIGAPYFIYLLIRQRR